MTAPTLTLEMAEEREFWMAVFARATVALGPKHARKRADDAVLAYRERCAQTDVARAAGAGAQFEHGWNSAWARCGQALSDIEGYIDEHISEGMRYHVNPILDTIADARESRRPPSPIRIGCTIPEAMRDRRSAGESVESLARDYAWGVDDVRAVTERCEPTGEDIERDICKSKAALADALIDRMGYADEGDPVAFLGGLLDELQRLEDGPPIDRPGPLDGDVDGIVREPSAADRIADLVADARHSMMTARAERDDALARLDALARAVEREVEGPLKDGMYGRLRAALDAAKGNP